MKKSIALLLVLCMVAVLLPAFGALSFADAAVGTVISPEDLHANRTQLETKDSAGDGSHGFIDGNAGVDKPIAEYLNISGDNVQDQVMAVTRVFVDGVEARFNKGYQGYKHAGLNVNGNYFYGVVGAAYTKGVPCTLTIWAGNDYYIEQTFTPAVTALAVASSTSHVYGDGGCDITVTFADSNHGITEANTVSVSAHDNHDNTKVFTVTNVNGAVVTLHSNDYTTGNTLLECTVDGKDVKFSLPVDSFTATHSAKGSIQLAADSTNPYDAFNTRIVVESNRSYLNTYKTAAIRVVFTTVDGKTKTGEVPVTEAFLSLMADGQKVAATDDCVLFGVQVNHVPYGTQSVKGSLVLSKADGDTSDTIELGEATLPNNEMFFVRPGYAWVQGELNVTSSTGKNTGNESAPYLFDKTAAKYGFHSGGNDQIITWNYSTPKTITMYELFAGNDTGSTGPTGRNPRSWTFEGSVDGTEGSWQLIDEQTGDGFPMRGAGKTFTVSNPTEYQYYRITFKTNADYFQLNEIRMFEAYEEGFVLDNYTEIGAPAAKSTNKDGTGNESLESLFDGNKGNKMGIYGDIPAEGIVVTWNYDEAQTVTAYAVTAGNDSAQYGRQPDSWTLYACNGDDEWVVLHEYDSRLYMDSTTDYIMLRNTTAYTHYKLVFKTGSNQFQMSEVTLYKNAQ